MKQARKRRKPEQIVKAIAEGEAMLAAGKSLAEVYQKLGIVESTWMRWKKQYGGMKSDEARRLRELEIENQKLKELLAEAELDKRMLKVIAGGKLLSPTRRREAACKLQSCFGVLERRACRTLGQSRSSQRYRPNTKEDEPRLVARILELVREFPRYGYRRITRLLRQEGWRVNFKRIHRLWKQQGLKVPVKKAKKRRLGNSEGGVIRRSAEYPNHVWSVDFIFDRTEDGRSLKILSLIDEFTRECIALEVGRKFTGDDLVALLSDLFVSRGIPSFIRSDNGPEFISKAVRSFLDFIEVGTSYIEPGSPWQNGYVESFHSRLRDECLSCELFSSLSEAQSIIESWRQTYNHRRPHSGIGGMAPADFASQWATSASFAALPSRKQPTVESFNQPVLS
ncbi:IS3 family transposase [Crateriforma conspicua]|uniref:IS3 family transposase n=1 Tax=Crateriforma conspicua TaxID=2527996 RepID=UPI0011A04E29|nr:IS3 family transposase [Crateriforma conspicua]